MWCFDTGYNKNETNEAAVADICKLRCVQVLGFVWKPPVLAAAPLVLGEERCSDHCSPVVSCCVTPVGYRGARGLWMQGVTSAFRSPKGEFGCWCVWYRLLLSFCSYPAVRRLRSKRENCFARRSAVCARLPAGALRTSRPQLCCRAGWLFGTICSAS